MVMCQYNWNMSKKSVNIGSKQLIVLGSIVLTGTLLAGGTVGSDTMLASFIGTNVLDTVLRVVILAGLVTVLVTRPPRPYYLRVALGVLSSIILIGAFAGMADFHIGILDAVLYLLVSNILAMEAIEDKTAPVGFSRTTASE